MTAGLLKPWAHGRTTQTAGTLINLLAPARGGHRTRCTKFQVTNGATAHTLTALRELNRTTVKSAAAGGQAVLTLTSDPGAFSKGGFITATPRVADDILAASDWLVFKMPDGTQYYDLVSSVAAAAADGSIAVTMTNNLPTGGLAAGARCYFLGQTGDTDPHTGEVHPVFTIPASGVETQGNDEGLVVTEMRDSPILLQESNATNAAIVEYASGDYCL